MLRALPALLTAAAAFAQTIAPPSGQASISGTVRYGGGKGPPVIGATVSTQVPETGRLEEFTTDNRGRYKLRDLPSEQLRVSVSQNGVSESRTVTLQGFAIDGFDLYLPYTGAVMGHVLDDAREPVAGANVFAVTKVYFLGQVEYRRGTSAISDGRGAYRIPGLPVGEETLILAARPGQRSDSGPILADTFYPSSTSPLTAVPVSPSTVGQVDIRMVRTTAFCAAGVTRAPGGTAANLPFTIGRTDLASGRSEPFGPAGNSGADGIFQLCGLTPGDYHLTTRGPFGGAWAAFTIGNDNVQKVEADVPPLTELGGDALWEGPSPVVPDGTKITIRAMPLDRDVWPKNADGWSEDQGVKSAIPGKVEFPLLPLGDYEVTVDGLSNGRYVKDLVYGGWSVLHVPLHLGAALGSTGLRIVVAQDGGRLVVQVNDFLNRPAGGSFVYALPDSANSEAALSDSMIVEQTDQLGQVIVGTVPPGKYYVLAFPRPVSKTAEGVQQLWRLRRTKGMETEIGAGGVTQVTLMLPR